MVTRQDWLGNLLFYDYVLSKRIPTFLNRNLTRAFRFHQQELEGSAWHPVSPCRPVDRQHWAMPTSQSLETLVQDVKEREAFVLEIKGIEALGAEKRSRTRPAKKKGPLFTSRVDLYITITDPTKGRPCQKIAKRDVRLTGVQTEQGRHVLLAVPTISIRLEDLLLPVDEDNPNWRKSAPQPWMLTIALHFRDDEDAKELHSHMPRAAPLPGDVPTRLVAQHSNILHCLSADEDEDEEQVLPCAVTVHGEILSFGFRTQMYWSRPKDTSILAAHNRQINAAEAGPTRYPTPPHENQGGKKYELSFCYRDQTIRRHGLLCPHDTCRLRKFNTLDELRMHLDAWHDLYRYRYKNASNTSGVIRWEINCEIESYRADQQRASNAALDPLEISMMAPKKPFNRRRYLNEGNDEYQRRARLDKVSSTQPAATATVRPKPKLPSEVKERVQSERKTYRVPKAPPNVTFFRAITKRPVAEGEYISESDDEVDMTWVELKKQQTRKENNISEPTQRLLAAFDPFIRDERLQSDLHIGDAVLRFARTKAALLWQEHITEEFQTKLDHLFADKIITKEIYHACLEAVEKGQPSPSSSSSATQQDLSKGLATLDIAQAATSSSTARKVDKGKGKAKVSATGQLTPQTADSEADVEMRDADAHMTASATGDVDTHETETPPYEQCLCGEDAMGTRGRPFIVCEGIDCIRYAYHISCVTRIWKPAEPPDPKSQSWICKECEMRADGDTVMT
ncbi:hypothetical protein CC80DRAFT_234680 [Byssothecium circinans]|uniref:Polycomb protein VEFS-Box domain-containing protein n=1 Tax=Byssothecium circinans TaxID=147558 RepID=A0A6A5UAC2_9PLEO|nr:hypothetical protein CC80DRAFT_234680 [Byssothecium circinans]